MDSPDLNPSEPSDALVSSQPTGNVLDSLIAHFTAGSAGLSDLEPELLADLRQKLAVSRNFAPDMKQLWHLLEQTFARAGGIPRARESDGFRLLNLACGHCEEAAVLSAFFSSSSRDVRQFALDLREHEIDKAKRRYAATEDLFRKSGLPALRADRGNSVEFIADDATRLVKYGQIPSSFEVIFMRHQNLWNGRLVWRRIFEFALARLAPPHGVLVITSYFDQEHLQALELLRALGGVIVTSARNPNSRELDHPGKSVDRHIAAIRQLTPHIKPGV